MKLKTLKTLHGNLKMPAFFPDATYGHVIGLESKDLVKCKIEGVVVNAYHLFKSGLLERIKDKGIHKFMNFLGIVVSDSGGFQVMSLIHKNPKLGKISGDKIIFNFNGKKIVLTPEKCIQIQLEIGSDIIMCLDDCTYPNASIIEQKKSVARTIRWARKCKKEFDKLTSGMKNKPMIFAIVQGGESKKLRKYCAEKLVEMDFDGYAFGGFPVKNGKFLKEILEYTSSLIPDDRPKFALGIGKPKDIIDGVKLGYNIFDCVIPTRDARHKRLFIFEGKKIKSINIRKKYLKKKIKLFGCGFDELYNLFKLKDNGAGRLATMHNLKFYSSLMEKLRYHKV